MIALRPPVVVTAVLLAGLTGCGSSRHTSKSNSIITANGIGPVRLGESREKVEATAGKGRVIMSRKDSLGGTPIVDLLVSYPAVSIRVTYIASKGKAAVFTVETTSPDYRTKSGVGVGSTAAEVEKIGADCGETCSLKNESAGTETDFVLDPHYDLRTQEEYRHRPVVPSVSGFCSTSSSTLSSCHIHATFMAWHARVSARRLTRGCSKVPAIRTRDSPIRR
jgi:hypothetical protein